MLKPSLIRFLIRLQTHHRLAGPLLTLGVQDVLLRYDEAVSLMRSEGIEPEVIPIAERGLTTSLHVRQTNGDQNWIHARTLFRLLGITDYDDLDASTSEGPRLVHDLNEPVPSAWHERYNWVLDGGTLEHVFDVRSTLSNIVRLTRIGGHVLHVNPMSGWANHGFYQFSPCLYHDFYRVNGFTTVASYFAVNRAEGGLSFIPYEFNPNGIPVKGENMRVLFLFLARREQRLDRIVIPTQTKYLDRLPEGVERRAG